MLRVIGHNHIGGVGSELISGGELHDLDKPTSAEASSTGLQAYVWFCVWLLPVHVKRRQSQHDDPTHQQQQFQAL